MSNLSANRFPTFLSPFDISDMLYGTQPYTLIEQSMIRVMGEIKSKSYWYEKIRDESIVNSWKEEIRQQNLLKHESQLQYIFDELIYYSHKSNQQLSASSVDGVWMSNQIIDEVLTQRFAGLVAEIEAICTDYHPDSNEQMLDIVHPHLYPYVKDLTRIISDETLPWSQFIGGGEVSAFKSTLKRGKMSSETYQWLPSEVQVDNHGKCTFLSYINNLHPRKHNELYRVLEQILEGFLPLFNNVLTDLATVPSHISTFMYTKPKSEVFRAKKRRHNPNMSHLRKFWIRPTTDNTVAESEGGDHDDQENEDGHHEEFEEIKILSPAFQIIPPFIPPSPSAQAVDLKGSRLQVIVKLANIILTPEKPEYNGGAWHIEGKMI